MLDLIIKGGQVVTPQGADVMDIGVQGDKIVAVGWPGTLAADAARVIDATGKIVVPGGIEPHAHIGIPVPEHWAGTPDVFTQPPEAASRAAAFGGVTTVIDFAGTLALDPAKVARSGNRSSRCSRRGARCSGATAIPTSPSTTSWPARSPPPPWPDRRGHPGRRGQLQDLHDVPADPRAVRSPVEHLLGSGQARRASWPCTPRKTTSSRS